MSPNVKVCEVCGEESLRPYSVFPDDVEDIFVESWVCVKCYNSVELIYDRNKHQYVNK